MIPYITVLINTINEVPERLTATINSFKVQSGVKVHILISTVANDISVKIGTKLNCDICINEKKGIYEQLNNAVNFIKGDWWCYSSGHDLAEPNKLLNEVYHCINENKLICYSNYYAVNPDTNEKVEKIFYKYDYEKHLTGNFINDCALINTELSKKYLPFRNELWGNDSHYDFWLRIYEKEGNVFSWNKTPAWNYILFNDSKHIERQRNEKEIQEYKILRKKMLDSHINKPLITVGLPTYNSKIVGLAMESLCNQQTTVKWELIICEDKEGANGEYFYRKYQDRLINCINFKYIEVSERTETSDHMALSLKWRIIANASAETSIGLVLQDSDDYSEPTRIQTAYEKFTEGYDWIHSRFGLFYHIYLKKNILFDFKTTTGTGLNKAIRMNIAKQLPNDVKWSSVDTWLFSCLKNIKPDCKIYLDETENYKNGFFTDGENCISKKRKDNYTLPQTPFQKTNLKICKEFNNINQAYVSYSLRYFEDKLFSKFMLRNERADKTKPFKIDTNEPLLVFGCYNKTDIDVILSHKSDVLILWGGSDSMPYNYENMKRLNKSNIFHVSGSKWISEDLKACGLKYKYYPVSVCKHNELNPCELGNKIYVYSGHPSNPEFYGVSIVNKLVEHYGADKFIIATATTHTKQELYKLYAKCFIGLRLVKHDGLSETVAELGLMGRNVVYNGDTPNSLHYTDVADIIKLIDIESKKTGIQKEVSDKMRSYLDVGNDWLNIANYRDNILDNCIKIDEHNYIRVENDGEGVKITKIHI